MGKLRNHEILKSVGCLGSQQLVKLKVSKSRGSENEL